MKAISVFAFVVLISAQANAATAMTGKELEALLSNGKDLILGAPSEGYAGELVLSKDGTGRGQAKLKSGEVIVIDGTWHIKGSKFWRTWKGLDAGKEICETWIKTGPTSVRVMNGKEVLGVNSWKP